VARHFGAELVSPAVAWLCSEKCEETANIITASAGGFARMQFFETKGAKEFGIERNGTVLTAMLMDVPTVRAIGLYQGQGLYYSNTFYWDRTDGTRAFTRRLTALNNGTYPSQNVAGAYSAVLHYLKAVAVLGVAKAKSDGRAVVARMKAMPYDDPVFGQGTVRADGRMMNPTYLFQVKRPAESRSEWDCSILAAAVAPDECIRPLAEGTCEMAKG